MKPTSIATFLVLLSTLCVIQEQVVGDDVGGAGGGESVKVIEEACQHSVHKDVCISSLKNDPNSKGADLTGLGYIAIRIAAQSASDIDQHLRSLMIDSKTMTSLDPEAQQGLADCVEFYTDANAQLDDSIAALSTKAYSDVEKWVNVAIANSESCDGSLSDGQKPIMTSKNEGFRQLCNNVLAILKVLPQH